MSHQSFIKVWIKVYKQTRSKNVNKITQIDELVLFVLGLVLWRPGIIKKLTLNITEEV